MSLRFSTTADHTDSINFGSNSLLESTAASVAVWFRCSAAPSDIGVILSRLATGGNPSTTKRFMFSIDSSGLVRWQRWYTTTNAFAETSALSTNDTTWQFVGAVEPGTGTAPQAWVGSETAECTEDSTTTSTAVGSLRTGSQPMEIFGSPRVSTEGFSGDIAALAIFNSALTEQDFKAIQFDFENGCYSHNSNLQGLWLFDNDTSTLYDYSENQLNSTSFTGTPTFGARPPLGD